MSTALQTTTTDNLQTADHTVTADLTRAELEAIADDTLGESTIQRKLWGYAFSREAARNNLRTFALRSGYPDSISNKEAGHELRKIVGKMESKGIPRAHAYNLMTGWTPRVVADTLMTAMEQPDDIKTATRAAEVSARCLGMMASSPPGVTVQINLQIKAQVAMVLDDCETDTSTM